MEKGRAGRILAIRAVRHDRKPCDAWSGSHFGRGPRSLIAKESWDNAISTAFGIRAIPTMVLVNKKGVATNPNARADLDGGIAKLLAE